jgi:hypothetical protein
MPVHARHGMLAFGQRFLAVPSDQAARYTFGVTYRGWHVERRIRRFGMCRFFFVRDVQL